MFAPTHVNTKSGKFWVFPSLCVRHVVRVMEWTDDLIYKLISFYEEHDSLYDLKQRNYHNKVLKDRLLKEAAEEIGTTGIGFSL